MCLLTNEHRPKIAKEDMTVWKIVHITTKGNKTVLTGPYFNHFSYSLGVLYKNNLPLKKKRHEDCYGNKNYAVEAAFHSYNDLNEALSGLRIFKELLLSTDYVLAECTIPEGTKYYTDATEPEIASEQIRIDKIIK